MEISALQERRAMIAAMDTSSGLRTCSLPVEQSLAGTTVRSAAPVLPAAIAATRPITPLEPNAEDLAGRTVPSAAPGLLATIAATHPNTGTQRCSLPVEQSLAGEVELSVALAQLATTEW
jgi:hypothetical protein